MIEEFLAKEILKRLVGTLFDALKDTPSLEEMPIIESALSMYTRRIQKWASVIQIVGMSEPKDTDSDSISLSVSLTPRRYRPIDGNSETASESIVLGNPNSYVILGDPGAGKTTTIKRIISHILQNEPGLDEQDFRLPVLVLLRDLQEDEGIFQHISKQLGVFKAEDEIKPEIEEIIKALESLKAIVLVDGLDELPPSKHRSIVYEIKQLHDYLLDSKIILTSRSGGFAENLEGFSIVEVCPLDMGEIKTISTKWCKHPRKFLNALKSVPYKDMANRPLLLTQLIVLHNNFDFLPPKPTDVIRKLLNLQLEQWDQSRGVIRRSVYADFFSDRKLDFLSALSFYLLYKTNKKSFDEDQLVEAYMEICQSFGLPEKEANLVVKEIESHTGIIIAWGDSFEFSHLSLQEYLCGYYIVRDSANKDVINKYMAEYPDPVAIACALSPNPSTWFSRIFLEKSELLFEINNKNIQKFLSRITVEKPSFSPVPELGYSILLLIHLSQGEDVSIFVEMLSITGVSEAISKALTPYVVVRKNEEFTRLSLENMKRVYSDYRVPPNLMVGTIFIDYLEDSGHISLHQNNSGEWGIETKHI